MFSDTVMAIHTLGPRGTNCELAARTWLNRQEHQGSIELHDTLEAAVDAANRHQRSYVVGCVVYPELHNLVFKNRGRLRLVECFVMDTMPMVLASAGVDSPAKVASHPAPVALLDGERCEIRHANSNSAAALMCASGVTDGCITTLKAAEAHGLRVLRNFGPIPMGFTVHEVTGDDLR